MFICWMFSANSVFDQQYYDTSSDCCLMDEVFHVFGSDISVSTFQNDRYILLKVVSGSWKLNRVVFGYLCFQVLEFAE